MIKTLKTLLVLFTLASVWTACDDEAPKAILNREPAPNELHQPAEDSYVFTLATADETFETFEWEPTNYGFKAATSYKLQIDVAGNDFADAKTVLTTYDVAGALKGGEFNNFLLALGLPPEQASTIEMRVESFLRADVDLVYSNVISFEVTPYATTFAPIWGMGSALQGWGPWPDKAVEWQSNEYKKYSTVTYLTQNEAFRFFEQLGWDGTSYNYEYFTSVSDVFENANDGDKNLKVVAESGWYKIDVDLLAKTITTEATTEPQLFMVGAAVGGWDQTKAVKMTYLKPGVFIGEADFTVETFRFFGQNDWGPISYNYPFFESVDHDFENAEDDDKNLRFIGTPGTYTLIVDLNAKTVTIPELYMTGGALNGWDWGPGIPVPMTAVGQGVFEGTATFHNGEAFRFFAQADWGPTSYNYPYFANVAGDFENAEDDDKNLRYIGTTGERTVRVDLNAKTVTFIE